MATVLRGLQGRNPGVSDDTTRHLLGRSVRVLAFHLRQDYGGPVGLAFLFPASRMIRRRQDYGGTGSTGTRSGEWSEEQFALAGTQFVSQSKLWQFRSIKLLKKPVKCRARS